MRSGSSRNKASRFNWQFRPFLSASRHWRKILMCDAGCFLGEVISGFEISAEEPHIPLDVDSQQQSAVLIGELAMNAYGGRPSDSGYLTRHFATLLEASNRA